MAGRSRGSSLTACPIAHTVLNSWNGSTQRECGCVNTSKVQVVRQPCATPWTTRSKPSTMLSLVAKLFVSLCDHWCKSPEINTLDSPSHGNTSMWLLRMEQWHPYQVRKQMPVASELVHSWFTPGALLVHSWCTPGALPVHLRCTPGALSVHSKGFPKGNCFASERKPRSSVQKRLDRFFANLQTRKGIAPLPKGSLDPLYRNVRIAFLPICKLERELHCFRKEVSIFRTETFGSPFRQLANPKRELHRFRKEASILRTETFGSSSRQLANPKGKLHRFRKEVSILRTETFGSSFRQLANPKGKLHRFRKEVSILRTETFGSSFRQLANPKGKLHRFRKEVSILRTKTVWIAQEITTSSLKGA